MISYKIAVWGAACTGKTALLGTITVGRFTDDYVGTIGANFSVATGTKASLQFWDIGGDKRYRSLTGSYCKDANLFIYFIDLTQNLKESEIRADIELMRAAHADAPLILVGTKADLPDQKIFPDALGALAGRVGATDHFSTSAKTNKGIDDLRGKIDELATTYALSRDAEERNQHSSEVVLQKLPNPSDLRTAMFNLFAQLYRLPASKRTIIIGAADTLIKALKHSSSIEIKSQAIEAFQSTCAQVTKDSVSKTILKAIGVVTCAAVVALITGLIGFGVGLALGAWTGPGALITGFLGASSGAALGVAAVSGTMGIIAGGCTAHRLFKPSPLIKQVSEVSKLAGVATLPPDARVV